MKTKSKSILKIQSMRRRAIILTAAATAATSATAVHAGTTTGAYGTAATISISGSTALKNFVTGPGFTYLEPGSSINLSNGYISPSWQTYNADGSVNVAGVTQYQLAPTSYAAPVTTGQSQQSDALRVEYHESGSVEGILEMANDQIGNVSYVESSINRDPNSGNAVWVNGNQIGGVSPPNGQQLGSSPGGYYLGPVYGTNSSGGVQTYGPGIEPTFNLKGVNVSPITGTTYPQAGQNAVQLAVSDVIPVQAFANTTASTDAHASQPWLRIPSDLNYGTGNTSLATGLGVAKGNNPLQPATLLNMPATAINPRTGTAFGTGPWNTAALNNLNSQQLAVTATLFDANPGTGLDRLDRTDAQWLQTTGRLANGAVFNMTTRDVNSGTRNVSALNIGIDPSWSVGSNDNGNGNLASGAAGQINIGSGMRFSNKTAGGAQLRPTIQNNRMAIGTLSAGDTSTTAGGGSTTLKDNQSYSLRALEYSDSTDGSSPYVVASATNIVNANYVIYQNEQLVTLKSPDASAAGFNQSQWAAVTTGSGTAGLNASSGSYQVPIQGDNAQNSSGAYTYDVAQVRDNVLNTDKSFTSSTYSTPQQQQQVLNTLSQSSYALLAKGFILPQFMVKNKPMDGVGVSVANPSYDSTFSQDFLSSTYAGYTTEGNPDKQFAGSGNVYGGSSGSSTAAFTAAGAGGTIPITYSNFSNGMATYMGGNWLFGNFNQNGIRDFSSVVVTAETALAALESSGLGNSAFSNGTSNTANSNSAVVPGLSGALASMSNSVGGTGATKGDLIVMGDYDGRGVFDGRSLYELAVGASLADSSAHPQVSGTGAAATVTGTDTLTVGGGTSTVMNADGTTSTVTTTFGDAARNGKLFKNTALDYLNQVATTQMRVEAAAVLTSAGSNVPAGATDLHTQDAVSGNEQFTYDPAGTNAFNKSDVNRDGVVDFNDALLVDQYSGSDYTNQANTLTATEQAPVTGTTIPANLVLLKQSDASTTINAGDLAIVNTALTGTGTTNWYGYTVNKSGAGTISWQRSGGVVNVTTGAAMQISAGTVQVMSSVDPFTDNNANMPASATDTSKSLAITLTGTGKLEYTGTSTTGTQIDRLSSLNVSSGASVSLHAVSNHANHTLLIVGGLSLSSTSKLDLNNNDLLVQGGNLSNISLAIKSGFGNGTWTGNGIISSSAIGDSTHLTTLGVMVNGTSFTTGHKFDGMVPSANDVLVKSTYYGDANLSGTVDSADYTAIDVGYLSGTLTGWANGDFNYDNVVNGSDYTLIDNAFNMQGASLAAAVSPTASIAAQIAPAGGVSTAVPEPTALGLLGVGVGSLLGRRRRRA